MIPNNLLVVGLVRNCERVIKKDVARFQQALKGSINLKWLLIESDSDDRSVAELESLSKTIDNFNFITLGVLANQIPIHTERLATCRNKYLSEISNNKKYEQVKFVLMADFDGINNRISAQAIASCFERHDWDVCTANQLGPYYDIYALRAENWSPNNCYQHKNYLIKQGWSRRHAHFNAVYSRMIVIPTDADWIAVDSAFGGLGIYKRDVIVNLKYQATDENGVAICEHVGFHKAIKNNGYQIFINPRLINARKTPHTKNLFFPYSLMLKIKLVLSHRLVNRSNRNA